MCIIERFYLNDSPSKPRAVEIGSPQGVNSAQMSTQQPSKAKQATLPRRRMSTKSRLDDDSMSTSSS